MGASLAPRCVEMGHRGRPWRPRLQGDLATWLRLVEACHSPKPMATPPASL